MLMNAIAGSQMRVMIVDNDPTYLGLLFEELLLHGYDVVAVPDGEQALSKSGESEVDLIFPTSVCPG